MVSASLLHSPAHAYKLCLYRRFNKPWSFYHWTKNHTQPWTEEIIGILDPDEFFLSPVSAVFALCL